MHISPSRLSWPTAQLQSGSVRYCTQLILMIAVFYFGFELAALAETATFGAGKGSFTLFDALVSGTESKSAGWQAKVIEIGKNTFTLLAIIEFAWAALYWAFQKDNLSSLSVEIIKKIMLISFFYLLLTKGPDYAQIIIKSFSQVGSEAMAIPTLTTDKIIATGLAAVDQLWKHCPTGFFSILGALDRIIMAAFATVIVIIAFVIVAAQWLCIAIEASILLAAGAIFLAFGASSFLKSHTEKYFSYALNVGVRLLVLTIVVGLMISVSNDVTAGYNFKIPQMMQIAGMAIVTCLLAMKAPEMASSAFGASFGLSAGGVAGSAQSGISSAMSLAGGALAAGRASLGKAVSVGQGMSNLHRASQASSAAGSDSKASGDMGVPGLGASRGSSAQGAAAPSAGAGNSAAASSGSGDSAAGAGGESAAASQAAGAQGAEQRESGQAAKPETAGEQTSEAAAAAKPKTSSPYRPVQNLGRYAGNAALTLAVAGGNGLIKGLTGKDFLAKKLASARAQAGDSTASSSRKPGSLHMMADLRQLKAKAEPPKGL